MHVESLGSSDIVAVAAKSFLNRRIDRLTLSELQNYPLVFRERGSKTRQGLEDEALRAGVVLNPEVEVDGREAMLEIVASGVGIGFVSRAEFGNDPRLVKIELSDLKLSMFESLVFLRQREEQRMIRSFMNC